MAGTALEKIQAIQEEAQKKIAALKAEAVTEISKKIAGVKAELAALEAEYASLTGKTLKGDKAAGTRTRLNADQKAALVDQVTNAIRAEKNGIGMGALVAKVGASVAQVRDALKQVKGVKTTGVKASTRYFLK